ncbi:FAD-dependent oxidoreductase [Nonomuraea sp. KC401]|uniref:NAD(P)/FAD-dependent oxidoreductase n=1 Tax=unclassified Nonomuraea TaxID=2593643 RepID=UPI0010FED83E|nr:MULTISPECIES: FAD-dependent oxidoreductase [unclassified Nonomuraea]NBE97287.1 FAD-dependent oxidoreductase [Nonomuraea sp. K271]TLF56020.1 FAD-dependent oxidoreductase [Nonomuraea sp. KC401]
MVESAVTRPNVVVLGGGYGGHKVAKLLDDVAEVTLVDPSESFVHNVASWRALVEPQWLDQIFIPYSRLLVHGRYLRDRAVEADGRRVALASGRVLEPDYLVLATGTSYPFPAKMDEPGTEAAKARVRNAHEALRGAERVLLIGAGPAGLELAGEIKAFFPGKHVTVADAAPDILPGPFDQELRDELRKQLDAIGIELKLGSRLRELPGAPPAAAAPVAIATEVGEKLTADIWFRCFGATPRTDYLRGSLALARDERGYVRVDKHLRVRGHERVFAIGDIADADRDMAAFAGAQGELLAANLRTAITGEGSPSAYERHPAMILVPLGPERGAGQLPGQDGIVGPETAAELKGRSMLVERAAALFDAHPA